MGPSPTDDGKDIEDARGTCPPRLMQSMPHLADVKENDRSQMKDSQALIPQKTPKRPNSYPPQVPIISPVIPASRMPTLAAQ